MLKENGAPPDGRWADLAGARAGARLQGPPCLDHADLRRGGRRDRPDRGPPGGAGGRVIAMRRPGRAAAHGAIRAYQLTLSGLVGRQCRHLPSCSDYTDEAIQRHGFWAGGWMGLARLCRCGPFGTSGLDLVCEELPARRRLVRALALRPLARRQRAAGSSARRSARASRLRCFRSAVNESWFALSQTCASR